MGCAQRGQRFDMKKKKQQTLRYAVDRQLPNYSFVPGLWPHPRLRGGHSSGIRPPLETPLDAQGWRRCEAYLYGVDLFNHGYYWEAHEEWEGLWRALQGLEPPIVALRALLQGLIRLAAAGVKVRQQMHDSVLRHAEAAGQMFWLAQRTVEGPRLCGLDLAQVQAQATAMARASQRCVDEERAHAERLQDGPARVRVVFAERLTLAD
jgi:predicted metal-dependent hydrolase